MQQAKNIGDNGVDFRQASGAEFATGHWPDIGLHHMHAIFAQLGDIALGGGMVPHAHIHGRHHHDPLVGRQQCSRGQIIGVAIGSLGQQVGRCGTDHNQIGRAGQFNMTHFGLIGQVEQVLKHFLPAQG